MGIYPVIYIHTSPTYSFQTQQTLTTFTSYFCIPSIPFSPRHISSLGYSHRHFLQRRGVAFCFHAVLAASTCLKSTPTHTTRTRPSSSQQGKKIEVAEPSPGFLHPTTPRFIIHHLTKHFCVTSHLSVIRYIVSSYVSQYIHSPPFYPR